MKVTNEQILTVLHFEDMAWNGGQTTIAIAGQLNLTETQTRRRLYLLAKTGAVYACAPTRRQQGLSARGRTPLLWFKRNVDGQ